MDGSFGLTDNLVLMMVELPEQLVESIDIPRDTRREVF